VPVIDVPSVAVIVAVACVVTAPAVRTKFALVTSADTTTEAGTDTAAGFELDSPTVAGLPQGGTVSTTLPCPVAPATSDCGTVMLNRTGDGLPEHALVVLSQPNMPTAMTTATTRCKALVFG